MVTFALPGDDVAEPSNATPRSRPPLPFAKRAYAASPYNSVSRRLGTPQSASSRKTLITRDDAPPSSVGRSFAGASNIFRASTISDSSPSVPFSPSFSQTPMKKVFAPGATPEPSRVQRDSVAQATPRGVAARAKDKDLFPMRIASPPRELTGEALTRKVPKEWDPKGSIYADQFLGDLCPPEFDDEQRRQFFCILDLRRLKYAADEIFCKKGWKLNVLNFAKEFEKSRSIILLHYGLYEFQNVKPSKDLIRRWRREHGLPPLEDDEAEASPSKPTSTKKKRKAVDDGSDQAQASVSKNKRRVTEKNDEEAPSVVATPVLGKNKRKASVSEDAESHPSKMQKQPSSARSMFEKAANKTSTTTSAPPPKFNPFAAKPTSNSLVQTVLKNNARSDVAQQPAGGSNIFGHLSDNSSSKTSDQEADAESETDSDVEEVPEDGHSDEWKAKRPPLQNAVEAGTSSDAGTRESTPGRSLFDRVSKGGDGQPLRAESPAEAPAETPAPPKDQTWNPSTTPIKFAPTTTPAPSTNQGSSLFASSASAGSLFAPKTAPTSSNLFGAPKQDKPAETNGKVSEEADMDGGESDKENDSQRPNKSAVPEPKPTQAQPSFGSLFQPKPASAEAPKEAEPAKPAATSNMFAAAASKPTSSATSNLFGSVNKPADSTTAAPPVMQSSTLFGAKASEPEKSASSEPAKPAFSFGAPATTNNDSASTGSLFAPKPAATGGNLFGNNASATSTQPLFGNTSSAGEAASKATAAPTASTPSFSFGGTPASDGKPNGTSQLAANKPLFGAPKSPTATTGGSSMFDGSPMKQDDKSPAKPLFGASNNAAPSTPGFSFGGASQSGPTSNIFGGAPAAPANNAGGSANAFGGANSSTAGGSGGFNFNFSAGGGGASTSSGLNNPFSSGNGQPGNASGSNTGGMFNFGASSSGPSSSGMFQFGGSNTGNSAPSGGMFGANQPNTNGAPAFGGSSTPPSGPVFSFGGAPSQPQQNQNNAAPAFLQPPSGGPSTGTSKSPFPGRKILPLKRRV